MVQQSRTPKFGVTTRRRLVIGIVLLGLLTISGPPNVLAAQFESKLVPSDPAPSKFFGLPVATDGKVIAVGATFDNQAGTRAGAVYVFVRTHDGWVQEAKLIGSDTAAEDQFGFSVALSRNLLMVGVPLHDAGAVYVFQREDEAWVQQAKLTADDATENTGLGSSVAIHGSTIAAGATRSEAAYVFQEIETGWVQTAKLTASDGIQGDRFGTSVSVSGNTIMVGAPEDNIQAGAVYVFRRRGEWTQEAKLIPDDSAAGDSFGRSVSVSGGTAVIGSPLDDDTGENSGAAYVFQRSARGWRRVAKLIASDATPADFFGFSVSLSGDTAVVGSPFNDAAGTNSGAAYVFERRAAWEEARKLTASDGATGDQFGRSVAVRGATVVVGAHLNDDGAENSGAAYVFNLTAKN